MMRTMAAKIYPPYYRYFVDLMGALVTEEAEKAQQAQARWGDLQSSEPSNASVQASFFAIAFAKRLARDFKSDENLYLLPDQGQQIQMFNFMAQKFPVVRYAQEIVNRRYVTLLKNEPVVTLWDIGIGNGQQASRLLAALKAEGASPKCVNIIGLDPSIESLDTACETLKIHCEQLNFDFKFYGIPKPVENLDSADWTMLEDVLGKVRGRWIGNASFALHHIHPVTLRTPFFQRLYALDPACLCIIEPYADFLTTSLRERFEHAWHHYGLAFWAIDQIDAPLESRNLLKSVFFGREIIDVIAKDDGRIEQFETGEMWASRLKAAGFALAALPNLQPAIPEFESIQIQPFADFTGFTAQGYPLISILNTGSA